VVMVMAGVSGVGKRDEGYRPLVSETKNETS